MDKTITFKGKYLSRTIVKNNIIKVYNQSTHKNDWYKDANMFCKYLSDRYKVPFNSVVGIVSALSPLKTWDKNQEIAEYFLDKRLIKKDNKFIQLPNQCIKAEAILYTDNEVEILDILSGAKTKSFYLNIRYPERITDVTIDRHAISIALGRISTDFEQQLSTKQYKWFVDVYKWTAKSLGIRPLLLQSITWETWRNIK